MTGDELRERIKRLGLSYTAAAPRLGLSLSGLHHNLRNETPIGRQTEIILDMLEREFGQPGGASGATSGRATCCSDKKRRNSMSSFTKRIGGMAAIGMAMLIGPNLPAQAGYVVTLEQVGNDVVATGS